MPTVFVTGANRGLGYEHVKQYAHKGWKVIACAREPGSAIDLQKLDAEYGDNFIIEQLDVIDHLRIEELAEKHQISLIPFLLEGVAAQPSLNQADGLHPTATGDEIVADTVMAALKPLLREKGQF